MEEVSNNMNKRTILALEDKDIDRIIKIGGTQYDRKRKLTDKQIEKCKRLYFNKNRSFEDIAKKFNVDKRTIRYHIDPTYRKSRIEQTTGSSYTKRTSKESFENRVAYKRQLVARGRVTV